MLKPYLPHWFKKPKEYKNFLKNDQKHTNNLSSLDVDFCWAVMIILQKREGVFCKYWF